MPVSQNNELTTDVKKEPEFDVLNAFLSYNQVSEKVIELENGWKIAVRELYGADQDLIFKLMVKADNQDEATFQRCHQAMAMKYLEIDGKKHVYKTPETLGELLKRINQIPLTVLSKIADAFEDLVKVKGNVEEIKK